MGTAPKGNVILWPRPQPSPVLGGRPAGNLQHTTRPCDTLIGREPHLGDVDVGLDGQDEAIFALTWRLAPVSRFSWRRQPPSRDSSLPFSPSSSIGIPPSSFGREAGLPFSPSTSDFKFWATRAAGLSTFSFLIFYLRPFRHLDASCCVAGSFRFFVVR